MQDIDRLQLAQARRYVDMKCLWYGKPLLESGTLSTQVFIFLIQYLVSILATFSMDNLSF